MYIMKVILVYDEGPQKMKVPQKEATPQPMKNPLVESTEIYVPEIQKPHKKCAGKNSNHTPAAARAHCA